MVMKRGDLGFCCELLFARVSDFMEILEEVPEGRP
jgi:hypothetical protein